MRVFLHPSKNEYVRTDDGIWVRNPCKKDVSPYDINDLSGDADKRLFLDNETRNAKKGRPYLSPSLLHGHAAVVVSDGLGFEEKHRVLGGLPKSVPVLAVNGAMRKWTLSGPSLAKSAARAIDYYVLNNPYPQCLRNVPKDRGHYPTCIASTRTHAPAIERYQGSVLFYCPPDEENFAGMWNKPGTMLDDYRNSVCAAISLAYKYEFKRILLLCCDDSYESERPGTVRLENGLWCYPQQLVAQRVIDMMLYWLKNKSDVTVSDCSLGAKYANATYISSDKVLEFLSE